MFMIMGEMRSFHMFLSYDMMMGFMFTFPFRQGEVPFTPFYSVFPPALFYQMVWDQGFKNPL